MIINRILFLAFLTLVNSFGIFGSAPASSAPDPFRISCIQLKAYDAADATKLICDTPHACQCLNSSTVSDEVKYTDIHGLGKTFDYATPESGLGNFDTPGTHAYFLKQVVDHKKANFTGEDDKRNTLFVQIQCKFIVKSDSAEQTEQTFNFYLGLFVSGRDEYYTAGQTVDKFMPGVPKGTPGNVSALLEIDKVRSAKQSLIVPEGLLYKMVWLYSNADSDEIERSNMTTIEKALIGSKKSFIVQNFQAKIMRFIMHSGNKKLDDNGYFVNTRFFPEPQRIGEVTNRDSIFWKLFGRLRYDPLTADGEVITPCIVLKGPDSKEVKDGLGNCFFDSEQSFLSMLENTDAPCETDFTEQKGVNYELSCVDLSFYSFRDMCRFCRGTFSHMLQKKYLQKKVLDFLTNRFDEGKFKAKDGHCFNVMVFGHEKTDKK